MTIDDFLTLILLKMATLKPMEIDPKIWGLKFEDFLCFANVSSTWLPESFTGVFEEFYEMEGF